MSIVLKRQGRRHGSFCLITKCAGLWAALAVYCLMQGTAFSANVLWTNTVVTATNWLATTNWNPNQVPGATDNAQMGSAPALALTNTIDMGAVGGLYEVGSVEVTSARNAATTIKNGSATTAGSLQIDQTGGGTFSIRNGSGNLFTITNGPTAALNINLNASSTAVIDSANGPGIVIGCNITNAPFGITKIGSAPLFFYGTNTYTGKTIVLAGALTISSDAALGTPPGSFVADQVQLIGGTLGATNSFTLDANRGIAITNTTSINVIGTTTDFVIAGVITGTGGITKLGSTTTNTLLGANTFANGYFLSGGTLRLGNKQAAGKGTITLLGNIGASADLTGVNAVTNHLSVLASAVTIPTGWSPMELAGSISLSDTTVFTIGSSTIFSGGVSGTADLARLGNGVFTLKGTNSYSGNTYFCTGTNVLAGNDNPLPTTMVSIGTNALSARMVLGDGSGPCNQTITDLQTLGTGTANAIVGGNGSISTLTLLPTLLKTFAGNIGGANANEKNVALTINGIGHGIILGGSNSYSGGTTITAGKLQVGSNNALPNGVAAGATVVNASASGGGLDLGGFSPTVNGLSGNGTVFASTGTSTLTVGSNNASSTFSGVIQNGSGTVALVKSGNGTIILTGANTYSGGTTVSGGTLQGDTTSLQHNITDNASLVFDQAADGTYSSALSGSGSVTKVNSGKLILSGTSTFNGSTVVNGGTLQMDGSMASSVVTVNAGAVLGGGGTTGAVTINSGATINAGASPGTLTTGAETWNSGGTNVWEVNDFNGTAGGNPGCDLINATSLNIAATAGSPFVVKVVSLSGTSAGNAANFNNAADFDRVIIHTTGGISGHGVAALQLDTSSFGNALASGGFFYLSVSGNDLVLSYRRTPVITADPASVTKQYADAADFTVGATGSSLTYQWKKNGNNIGGATGSTYHIASVSSSDVGTYFCAVSNTWGNASSQSATLTYTVTPPSITMQPSPASQTVVAGSTVTYSASASSPPGLGYQWTKNGGNISGATDSALALNNVQVTDTGSYAVVFTNADGSATSDSAVLQVTPTVVYVNGNFANPIVGQDPDGAGPATKFGLDSFATIQEGVNALASGGTVNIAAGNYAENVVVAQNNIELAGAGQGVVAIAPTSGTSVVLVQSNAVNIHGLSVNGSSVTIGIQLENAGTVSNCAVYACSNGVVATSNALVTIANDSITNNSYGIRADAALVKVKVENCDLRGNSVAALYADGGATVDAGNCGSDVTGLGASSGGNNLTSYLAGAKAVQNANTAGPSVLAQHNDFGATAIAADISAALTGDVDATQSGGLLVSDLGTVSIECLSSLPAAATNYEQYLAQGGAISATSATVTSSDSAAVYDGVIARTYTLTDACGQTNVAHQTINVHDAHAPTITTCPADRTLNVDSACSVAVPDLVPEFSFTDNCDVSLVTVTQSPTAGTLVSLGTTQVTITATDTGSNSSTCTVTLAIRDVTAPVLSGVPANTTVECASVPAPASPTATDNCDANPVVTFSPASTQTASGCTHNSYSITRTWTATDASGNSSSLSQVITVVDTTAPVLSNVPANTTVECNAIPSVTTPTATDNCSATPGVTLNETSTQAGSGCGHFNYAITRTWTASDDCGNSSTAQQVITVHDTTAPVLSAAPADVTVQCDSVPTAATLTATDNCDANPSVGYTQTTSSGSCPASYMLTRTWTASDACGNTSSATQHISVIDNSAPVLSGVPPNVTVECGSVPTVANPTATDNCDANPNVTILETSTQSASGCGQFNYSITRTWTALDICGNSSTAAQVITVHDMTAPVLAGVPANVTVTCGSVPTAASPTASDNCDTNAIVTLAEVSTQAGSGCGLENYTVTRTWTATDACGNTSTGAQTITVTSTAPTITGFPVDATYSCAGLVPAANDSLVSANDACGGAVVISHSADVISGQTCANRYTITRTYTATGACGDFLSRSQTITVFDNTAPVITTFPANATFDCTCLVADANDALVSATDNCGAVTVSHGADVVTNVVDARHYQIVRTYTATDSCGNAANHDQVFTMVIAGAPVLSFTGSTDAVVTNANYTTAGTASGDRPIVSVYYSLNNAPYVLATGTSSWHANVTLSPGTNTIAAYAVDNLTNSSVISNAIVFYSVTNKLTILVTDWPNKAKINSGILSPSLNGQMLQIGRNYTITATPGLAMHRFVGWAAVTNLTTPVFNTNATLTFMMQSNLTLVARFENPFFHLKGNWYGLFAEEPVVQRSAGYISISLAGITDTSVNKFSGKVMLAGVTSTFTARTAQFDINGHSSFVIPRVTGNLTVNLDLDVVNASTTLTGSVSTVNWTAPVTAYRALTNKTIGSLLRYTVAIPPDVNSPNSPIGYGFGTITLPASANVTMSGYLADGTTYTAQSLKLVDGWKLPLFANLYSKNPNALLWGWLQLTNGQPGVSGDIHWVRPAGIASQGLTAGFSNAVALIGSLYTNTASPSLNWTGPGTVFLYDDRYPGVTNNVQISGKIVTVLDNATFRNTNHLAVTISSGTGLVSGSFRNSTRRLTDTIRGVLLQNQGMAVGLRTGTNAGAFLMEQ